jgi:hypothetical protein
MSACQITPRFEWKPAGSDLPEMTGLAELKSLGRGRLLPDSRTQLVMPVVVEIWGFVMPQLVAEKHPMAFPSS